ncbi:MAG: LuxR C-terminal-related transcriptional regulator, partial [Nocardioides sp.]
MRSGDSAALFLAGEPGIGKTVLLDVARSIADDFVCLSASGAETEATLAHAGLLELLTPIRHLLDDVPEGQAAALGVALGWTSADDATVDRFLVAAGTLSLLAAAAVTSPVLVLIDDLHWLDRESADAIMFAARRLSSDAVGFVMNGRTGAVTSELVQGLPVLQVSGLRDRDAAELLASEVASPVVARLTSITGGNPLALLEVTGRLTPAQRMGASPLPDPLPVGDQLHTVYDAVLTDLPERVRNAVLLAALDSTIAVTAAGAEPLDEAVGQGILTADAHIYGFRHPLLRSAVLRLATPAQLREAHRTLALHHPHGTPASTHHLAAAATGPDDDLADALARISAGDRSRFGYAAASVALERSALLTRDRQLAADRLASAAQDAFVAGDLTRTRELVDQVLTAPTSPGTRGRALFTLGMLEQYAGSVPRAGDRLTEACTTLQGAELVDALNERALVGFRLGDLADVADYAARIEAVVDLEDPAQRLRARFTGGIASALGGDYGSARSLLGELTDLALSAELRDDPRALLLMALASGMTGTVDEALRRGSPRLDDVRRRGAIGVLVPILTITAAGRAIVGDHARAFAEAGEAVELAECLGYVAEAAIAFEMLAWESAARGFHDDARSALVRARELIDRAGTTSAAAHHAITAAFCALCRDDLPQVVELLEARLDIDGGVGEMGEPLGVAPLLIEAYAGLGRTDDMIGLTRRYAEVTPAAAPAEHTALVLRCQGLAARGTDEAEQYLQSALEVYAGHAAPFEEARTRLLLGSRLRRDGRRVAAREHLRTAHGAFTEMELTRWAELATAELGATGASVRSRTAGGQEGLTSQETRVALLVAEGRSNKEVAASLFLSPRTVERHLGNVFRKKGFRSRTELARA